MVCMLKRLMRISETQMAWGYWGAATRPRPDLTVDEIAAREILINILNKANISLFSFHTYVKAAVDLHSTLTTILKMLTPLFIKNYLEESYNDKIIKKILIGKYSDNAKLTLTDVTSQELDKLVKVINDGIYTAGLELNFDNATLSKYLFTITTLQEKLKIRNSALTCVSFQQGKRENSTSIVNSLPQDVMNQIYEYVCPIVFDDNVKRKRFISNVSKNKSALFAANKNVDNSMPPEGMNKNAILSPKYSG